MTDFSKAEVILEIKNLSVDYGYTETAAHVLRGVSLTLHEGEVLGLAGESGCGKSTLVYGATRLLPPPGLISGGEVWIKGRGGERRDLLTLNDKELRDQRWVDEAVVFQGAMNSLNPVYKIGRQIKDGIQAHRPDWDKKQLQERAEELMDMVGISPDRLESFPHQLSGGMRQRVMIAMALALEPKVLIMDEPTTALDVVMQRQIVEQITELRKKLGFAVIFITHDMSLLIEIADRIAIMYAGQIIEDGPAMDLYRHSRHPYTRGLIDSFPPLHGPRRELGGIPGTPPDMATLGKGCPFAERCPFVQDECWSYEVKLEPSGIAGDEENHQVGCLLYEELKNGKPLPEKLAKDYK
ncbi:ABC transporter ATP-binding protein [Lactovum odontotermitis]